jgi:hypothetical protein
VENGRRTVCTAEPSLITVPEARVFILKCNTYLKRDPGRPNVDRLSPCDENGLYPGQQAPPVDYTDFDPEEIVDTPPVPLSLLEMHTEERKLQEYLSAEPECDT